MTEKFAHVRIPENKQCCNIGDREHPLALLSPQLFDGLACAGCSFYNVCSVIHRLEG